MEEGSITVHFHVEGRLRVAPKRVIPSWAVELVNQKYYWNSKQDG